MRASHLADDFHGLEPLLARYWWILFVRGALVYGRFAQGGWKRVKV